MGLSDQVSLKGGQVFDTLELGMIAAARGYGVSMGDLLMVAEDVAQGRLSLPWPTAVASGLNYYLYGRKPVREVNVCAVSVIFCKAKCAPWCCRRSSA